MAEYISSLTGQQMDSALIDMAQHNSEAWAVGKRNGTDVTSADPTYHNNAKYYAQNIAETGHPPYIGANGHWYVWDGTEMAYVDSGVNAQGPAGEDGDDGVSPVATVEKTGNTATITITDAEGTTTAEIDDGTNASVTVTEYQASADGSIIPTGTWTTTIPTVAGGSYLWTRFTWNTGVYSYVVARQGVNGTGTGDMEKSVYDADNTVANAGGIANYVDENGGKIDHIQINGVEQTITDKTVNLNVRPDLGTIDLSSSWTGSASPYSQTVTVTGATVTSNSKVDLQPDSTTLAQMLEDGCNALYIENNAGTLTLYAIGEAPTVALTIQVSVTEVTQ